MNQKAFLLGSPDPQEEELDAEIRSIRAEISTLNHRKRILTTSLLSSPRIKTLLQNQTPTTTKTLTTLKEDLSPLATAAGAHTTANHHRIAFGATVFPFKDPAPNCPDPNLLGIRIDVCARNGRFAKPYYVLLRQERSRQQQQHRQQGGNGNGKRLCVHRHTIPAFISVDRLAGVYLPLSSSSSSQSRHGNEGGSGSSGSESESDGDGDESVPMKPGQARSTRRKQDLRGFVRELRRELVAWHLRSDAVVFLQEKLGLIRDSGSETDANTKADEEEEQQQRLWADEKSPPRNDLGIIGLEATAVEARYVRMEWEDGRLGRFKLSNAGLVERAVFMNDRGRDKQVEDAVTGGGGEGGIAF
ncbi:hypothetical protein N7481_012547 [Penicillium waksmanii]|uniref:uncharacterized protein n=1 Tax=Penicillium waksmanii TaxID=69791 RepID=UPI0025485B7E|nr:uncharacterized protein N7481_012547 [Penicillium waksmanii]KAJ5965833.1 hypothetical protein N7481_012547 [Penicillium waksmanii]